MTESTTGRPEAFRTRDLTGWDVMDRGGEKIGSAADLLIDRRGRVQWLDVEFGFPRKHVLLPRAAVEWGEDRFIVGGWTREQVRSLPPYDPGRALDAPLLAEMTRAYPWMYDPEAEGWRAEAGETRIVPLSEAADFRVEKGAPDLKGWNVFGADGERLGTVTQILVDPAAMKVRYLDVDLFDDLFLLSDDRHVLVPLDRVDLKERGNDIWIQNVPAAEAARLPAYTGGAVPPALEAEVERVFAA